MYSSAVRHCPTRSSTRSAGGQRQLLRRPFTLETPDTTQSNIGQHRVRPVFRRRMRGPSSTCCRNRALPAGLGSRASAPYARKKLLVRRLKPACSLAGVLARQRRVVGVIRWPRFPAPRPREIFPPTSCLPFTGQIRKTVCTCRTAPPASASKPQNAPGSRRPSTSLRTAGPFESNAAPLRVKRVAHFMARSTSADRARS